MESQLKTTNNNVLIFVILGAFIFFVFIMPILDKNNTIEENNIKEHLLNINAPEPVKIYENICSRECCKFAQWPLPPELMEKTMSKKLSDNYIGSNMSCNGGDKGGCVCFSKDNFNYLSQRGGNSSSMSCSV
jgi:hypothetical protein